MMPKPYHVKRFTSAKKRFLHESINQFFKSELPFLGPSVIKLITKELEEKIYSIMLPKDHLRPGQILWNAVSVETRADHPRCKFIPVILTLIDPTDIQELVDGEKMPAIAKKAIARVNREAYQQGALLSMRDIALFSWRHPVQISDYRKAYEEENGCVLPHTGSLHDMGTCVSHKRLIIRKVVVEKKDPRTVAKETKHSQRAVDHYLKDFYRVRSVYQKTKDLQFVCHATRLSERLVKEYVEIINELQEQA